MGFTDVRAFISRVYNSVDLIGSLLQVYIQDLPTG